ncbi:hypothetical protein B0A63_14290 [Flavobacterium johnsoniae UW101]|nr:hypothetical protein B0A63_14290 [Flavobacterium johnsoniae UW101]
METKKMYFIFFILILLCVGTLMKRIYFVKTRIKTDFLFPKTNKKIRVYQRFRDSESASSAFHYIVHSIV